MSEETAKEYLLGSNEEDEQPESDPGPLGNPAPPPNVDLDMLRGDCIGDTVYSGKWCIQTVMKLMQSNVVIKTGGDDDGEDKSDVVDMDEELQNEVGALWDMTSNVEVCQYLHSIGAIESICYVITNSRCPRATEMCVGMLANIVYHNELWKLLHDNSTLFNILIQLLVNTDQPVLLEVTRFFNTALCHSEHTQCFTSLCENGQLVTQELLRILSGSTNTDLLKQASELTYNLVYSDEDDTKFGALFADGDFVLALLEASKELGNNNETSGQNYLIEVFHNFTTYKAGVLAIENCMEQIAAAATTYLKFLCKNLNLSNNTTIITTIIAILNHIFCRNVIVRVELMSSPSFIHCVLKTLVAVYRKLGFYNSIAYTKGGLKRQSDSKSPKNSSWKTQEESFTDTKSSDTASWSERANAAPSASSSAFRTPDASPRNVQRAKELEISWSERRISSPLVDDDFAEEEWKRPTEKKRFRKRVKDEDSGRNGAKEDRVVSTESGEQPAVGLQTDEKRDRSDKTGDEVSNPEKDDSTVAMKIQLDIRCSSTESRKSEGFSPQRNFEEMDTELKGNGDDKIDGNAAVTVLHEDSSKVPSNGSASSNVQSAEKTFASDVKNLSIGMSGDNRGTRKSETDEEDETYVSDNDVDELAHSHGGNSDSLNGDKYHKLLSAIQEFLVDYFNNLRETITTDDGVPVITGLMKYFNTQCRSVEIRAIVKCVGTDEEITHPFGRLLHMCDHFKADHMKTVLMDYVEYLDKKH